MLKKLSAVVASAVLAAMSSAASAASVTYYVGTATGDVMGSIITHVEPVPGDLAATAKFDYDGQGNLTILLTNLQAVATPNAQELAGVFWNGAGFSATLASVSLLGSVVIPDTAGLNDVGGFGYTTTGNDPAGSLQDGLLRPYGVSAIGLKITYGQSLDLSGNSASVAGINGSLVGTAGKGNIPDAQPVISNQFQYNFTGVTGLSINTQGQLVGIRNVQFVYGSTLPDTPPQIVPLPAAAWSGLSMLGALGVIAKVRRKLRRG